MTEHTNTPELRFPEFREEWNIEQVSDFLIESKIVGHKGNQAKKLTVKLWGKGIVEKESIFKGSSNTQYYIRKAGQLMYGKLDFLNCAFGLVPTELNNFESTIDSPSFDFIKGDKKFLLERIKMKSFYKKYGDLANGSRKAKRINQNTFLSMPLYAPTINEQKKIGDFFSKLDRQIELEEKKLELLEQQKRGYMQKIFSRELRFKDDNGNDYPNWENEKLGDLINEVNERTTSNNQYVLLSSTKNGLLSQEEYFKKQIGSKDSTGYKILRLNQLVLSPQNLWLGNINFNQRFDIGIVSPSYRIYNLSHQFDINFAKDLLKSPRYIYEYAQASEQGASVVRRNLNLELFYSIKISLPSIEEQRKIGVFLNKLDKLIRKQYNKIEVLKQRKKGLLQKMFV